MQQCGIRVARLNGVRKPERRHTGEFLYRGVSTPITVETDDRRRGVNCVVFENSGIHLLCVAIALWNKVYLEPAVQGLRNGGQMIPEALLAHLSPLKWEHINLTGDYHWRRDGSLRNRKPRPLRTAFA